MLDSRPARKFTNREWAQILGNLYGVALYMTVINGGEPESLFEVARFFSSHSFTEVTETGPVPNSPILRQLMSNIFGFWVHALETKQERSFREALEWWAVEDHLKALEESNRNISAWAMVEVPLTEARIGYHA